MPIQPIDLQTLFMRLSQVGKEQAMQREAAHVAQTVVASELVEESDEQAHTVTETRDLEDGPHSVKDEEQRGAGQETEEERRREEERKKKREVFRDPDLGSNIDIVG